MPKKSLIVKDNENIVLSEIPITVSDEKLLTMLRGLYERARLDAEKFKCYSLLQAVWSIFVTLLLTLVTTGVSSFTIPWDKTITFTQTQMTYAFWGVDILMLMVGVILLFIRGKRLDDQHRDRDTAVADCINAYCAPKLRFR